MRDGIYYSTVAVTKLCPPSGSSTDLPRILHKFSAVQKKLHFLTGGRLVARHMQWPHAGPHVSWPPGAHSAGRQALWLEMEPVAPNDFRRALAVACGQNLEACGLWPPRS